MRLWTTGKQNDNALFLLEQKLVHFDYVFASDFLFLRCCWQTIGNRSINIFPTLEQKNRSANPPMAVERSQNGNAFSWSLQ